MSVSASPGAQRTILIVDDEPELRRIARLALQREGYRTLEAATPAEAVRVAGGLGDKLDLLLTDVELGPMGGYELATRLSASAPQLQVLYFSGYELDDLVNRGSLSP